MGRKKIKAAFNRELLTYGRRLKMWRKKRKLTQEELADKAGLGYSHVNELENGKTDPGLTTTLRLSEALEVNPIVFFLKRDQAVLAQQLWGMDIYPDTDLIQIENKSFPDMPQP